MREQGWTFQASESGDDFVGDHVLSSAFMHQVNTAADPEYSGRVTVPVLWDLAQNTIVSNESADIIRMFNSAFDDLTANTEDFYPTSLRSEIDAINDRVYHEINNGVYKAGFATSQAAYDKHVVKLFAALDWVEGILSEQPFLAGEVLTEADWRLFTTLVRFDAVYVGHFKCNLKTLREYPHISAYVKSLATRPGIAETINIRHIKNHYYMSHDTINPTGVVPQGPELDFV